jgi:aspartate ammonia-lyase
MDAMGTEGTGIRIERDLLGEREVPAGALYGIHTVRAVENFPSSGRPVHPALIHAYGAVKLACARANAEIMEWPETKTAALEGACREMVAGRLDRWILVDALQGGAGTSTNMNVNEVLANRALEILGEPLGAHGVIAPLDDVNLHQSTNDTFPTALRIAAIRGCRVIQQEIVGLMEELQKKEREFDGIVKVGRTEMQDAVLLTLGRVFGAWAEAFARDRWRLSKCEERLRVVNLGGTAIGTGLGAPRAYIFRVIEILREETGLGLARAENLIDATQNVDTLVEVSGLLKACASNILKISGDLRFLSSGPDTGIGEIHLPPRQAGSSLMPGKVNPVIPEAATQAAIAVLAHDSAIAHAAGMGHCELNPFLPLIADSLLGSCDLLAHAASMLRRHCIPGIVPDVERCRSHVASSTAVVTALVEEIGHETAEAVAAEASATGRPIREIVLARGLMSIERFNDLTAAESVMRLGSPAPSAGTRNPSGTAPGRAE